MARWIVGALLLGGCLAEAHEPARPAVSARPAALIGGFEADTPQLDAVGSLSRLYPAGADEAGEDAGVPDNLSLALTCTGVLIDARTVVTAKRCGDQYLTAARNGGALMFAIGPDAVRPRALAAVLAVDGAPGDTGGYAGVGHDVSVMHLDRAITGVTPVKLATLDNSQIGQEFAGVGYGQPDNITPPGKRLVGALQLKALTGRTYELVYGSFDAYFTRLHKVPVPGYCIDPTPEAAQTEACIITAQDRKDYNNTLLEQSGDVLLSSEVGGGQPCYGDNGGPLLRANAAGELVAYAVVSQATSSDGVACDVGAVYSQFTPEVLSFIQQAQAWQDPCANVSPVAVCNGDKVRRCSSLEEGERRVIEMDCATLGMHCSISEAGASCH